MSKAEREARALRTQVLSEFSVAAGLPALERAVQYGNDPDTVRYTLVFDGGREVRIPGPACLFSRAQFNLRVAGALNRVVAPCKPAEWQERVAALVEYGVEIEERPGERFIDTVAEWVGAYADRASSDREGAAALRAPFVDEQQLHVVATELAKYVRREFSEQVHLPQLREALSDLGFERTNVHVKPKVGTRTSISYYRGWLAGDAA